MRALAMLALVAAGAAPACASSRATSPTTQHTLDSSLLTDEQRACVRSCRLRWQAPWSRSSCITACAEMDVVNPDIDWTQVIGEIIIRGIPAVCE